MAYVPLYGRVSDNQGYVRGTSCLRGRVDSVGFWLNSWFGDVLRVDARLLDGKQRVRRPDLRKVKRADRKERLKQYEEEVKRENRVVVEIDIPAEVWLDVRINGVPLSYDRLKLMKEIERRRFDASLKALERLKRQDGNVLQVAGVLHQCGRSN